MKNKKIRPLKPVIPVSEEEARQETERLNELSRKHPEPLIWYLYKCGRFDLSKKEKREINKWVRKELKKNPNAPYSEINEE